MKRSVILIICLSIIVLSLISGEVGAVSPKKVVNHRHKNGFSLVGAWQLSPSNNKMKEFKLYDSKGSYYTVDIYNNGSHPMMMPQECRKYTYTNSPAPLYIENGVNMHIKLVDNDTFEIVWHSSRAGDIPQTWKRANITDDLVQFLETECRERLIKQKTLNDLLNKNYVFD